MAAGPARAAHASVAQRRSAGRWSRRLPPIPGEMTHVNNTFEALRQQAASCTACDLYKRATQTVFGEGKAEASMMLVGEQPGHEEDLAGRPFVGPAGRLLDQALTKAGLNRERVYITNVVKHFKWKSDSDGGKRRIHERPNQG